MNEMRNTHRLNTLIDFLQGSKKNKRLLYKLLVILYVLQIPIIIYLAAFITPGEYPTWWQTIVDWGQRNIPSAQGWTGRTIAHREQMPAIYMVWFIFSIPALISAILLDYESFSPRFPLLKKGWRAAFWTRLYCCA